MMAGDNSMVKMTPSRSLSPAKSPMASQQTQNNTSNADFTTSNFNPYNTCNTTDIVLYDDKEDAEI